MCCGIKGKPRVEARRTRHPVYLALSLSHLALPLWEVIVTLGVAKSRQIASQFMP